MLGQMHLIEHEEKSLLVIAGRTTKSKDQLLEIAARLSKQESLSIQLLNASRVFGLDHVESAFRKALRAFEEEENVSESLAFETMLYISGCRQLHEALERIGLKDETKAIVCIAIGGQELRDRLVAELSILEDESLISDNTEKNLADLGIAERDRGTVPKEKQIDLVLERVAAVDIIKK